MPKQDMGLVNIRKPMDYGLLIVTLILLALGLIMVLSASAPYSLRNEGDSYHYFNKQLAFAAGGVAIMFAVSCVNYRVLKGKIAYAVIIVALLLLIAVLIPGVGVTRNGATRWLKIGFQFQPSEVMKIALIIFLSAIISKNPNMVKTFTGFVILLGIVGLCAGLVLLEDHLSATVIIGLIGLVLLFVAGAKAKYLVPTGIVGTAGIAAAAWFEPYRFKRLMIYLDPWADVQGDGWQIIQSLYAIGSGGIFGVGLRKECTKIYVHTRTT